MKINIILLVLALMFSTTSVSASSSQWLWYGEFPWVYSYAERGWWYMKAGSDGTFYFWKHSNSRWHRFDETTKQWVLPSLFTDANLERQVRRELNYPQGSITSQNLNSLEELYAEYENVSNLTGLEHAKNLTELSLSGNQLTNLDQLSRLTKIQHLSLDVNRLSDISPLSNLTQLTWLNLRMNNIDDISPLFGLTNLKELFLAQNSITESQKQIIRNALPNCRIEFSD